MKLERRLKKSLLLIRYLEEEEWECTEICDVAKVEIEARIRSMHMSLNVFDKCLDTPDLLPRDKTCENETAPERESGRPDWAKKVFKSIVMLSHPDRLPDDLDDSIKKKFLATYQKSKEALDAGDYASLLVVADDLDIDLSCVDEAALEEFNKKEKTLREKISQLKQSMYWVWAHSTEDQKEEIIKEFVEREGWTSRDKSRTRSRKGPGMHPGKPISWARKPKKKNEDKP